MEITLAVVLFLVGIGAGCIISGIPHRGSRTLFPPFDSQELPADDAAVPLLKGIRHLHGRVQLRAVAVCRLCGFVWDGQGGGFEAVKSHGSRKIAFPSSRLYSQSASAATIFL